MRDRSEEETLPPAPRGSRPSRSASARGSVTSAVRVDVAGLSDRGKVRAENQDHFLVVRTERSFRTLVTSLPPGEVPERSEEAGCLMMVADGMGGHAAGEVASRTAIVTLMNLVREQPDWIMKIDEDSARELQRRAVQRYKDVDLALAERAGTDAALQGMGTTMTAAYSLGPDLFIAHAGDSRAYLLRGGTQHQLTRDHTHVQMLVDAGIMSREEAATHQFRNVLTNVLGGGGRSVEVEIHRMSLADGDCLLLCTDGLTTTASDDEIAAILRRAASSEQACRRLVDLALERGAPDNVTVVAARYHLPGAATEGKG